jgi:hypothetical protein
MNASFTRIRALRHVGTLAILACIFFLPVAVKIAFVNDYVVQRIQSNDFVWKQVVLHDSWYICAMVVLYMAACINIFPLFARLAAAVVSFMLLLLYTLDVCVLRNFYTHVSLQDILHNVAYAPRYVFQTFSREYAVVIVFLACAGFGLYRLRRHIKPGAACALILVAICGAGAARLVGDGGLQYVHSWVYRNFLDYNLTVRSEGRPYSPDFAAGLRREEPSRCRAKIAQRKNVIVVMAESFSSYQSRFFSGIRDWTPRLDSIAADNVAFTNFHANGFVTEDATLALLTGHAPVYPPAHHTDMGGISYRGFYDIPGALPRILRERGYVTEFLVALDLGFANTGQWARSIGFDHVEGSEQPCYAGWDRHQFDSAPDEALFQRVFDRAAAHSGQPYFLCVQTISSHHPFENPANGIRSEEEAFRYTDAEIGKFYDRLRASDFFDNGILIIVGDHHAMLPLKREEFELFGEARAEARVPMILCDGQTRGVVEPGQYQHLDIYHHIAALGADTQCSTDWIGDLEARRPARYIVQRRGSERNTLGVFTPDAAYTVLLDGDDTRLLPPTPEEPQIARRIVEKINTLRVPQAAAHN